MNTTDEDIEILVQDFLSFSHFMKMHNRSEVLRPSEMSLLRCVLHHRDEETGEIKPSQISVRMGLQQPTVTPILRSLEEKGYLKRRNGEQDRREVYISATDKTLEQVANERKRIAEMMRGLTEFIGEDDTKELGKIMNKVSAYVLALRTVGETDCKSDS